MTEDIEFSCLCALNGIKIDYVEKAITYDEQPTEFKTSWHQRMRWTYGTISCFKLYSYKLIKKFFNNFSLSNIDLLFLFLSPFIQLISFIIIMINCVLDLFPWEIDNLKFFLNANIPSLLLSYVLFLIVSIFVVFYNKHKLSETFSGIILFMLFILTWLPINLVCLFKRKLTWKPIKHNVNVSIGQIIGK